MSVTAQGLTFSPGKLLYGVATWHPPSGPDQARGSNDFNQVNLASFDNGNTWALVYDDGPMQDTNAYPSGTIDTPGVAFWVNPNAAAGQPVTNYIYTWQTDIRDEVCPCPGCPVVDNGEGTNILVIASSTNFGHATGAYNIYITNFITAASSGASTQYNASLLGCFKPRIYIATNNVPVLTFTAFIPSNSVAGYTFTNEPYTFISFPRDLTNNPPHIWSTPVMWSDPYNCAMWDNGLIDNGPTHGYTTNYMFNESGMIFYEVNGIDGLTNNDWSYLGGNTIQVNGPLQPANPTGIYDGPQMWFNNGTTQCFFAVDTFMGYLIQSPLGAGVPYDNPDVPCTEWTVTGFSGTCPIDQICADWKQATTQREWTDILGGVNAATGWKLEPLSASFTAAPTNGIAPLAVTFTDTSSGCITNWNWNFGDGSGSNLTTVAVGHVFADPGTYTVTEIVSGLDGSVTNTAHNCITAAWPPPSASFTATPTIGVAPLPVSFTDTSTGAITNWFWTFGDASTTNVTTSCVSHIYTTAGTYTVTETVSGPGGSATTTPTFSVGVLTPAEAEQYKAWQTQYFKCTSCPQAQMSADADGTGENNFFKFVAGLDPTNPASVFVFQIVPTDQYMNLTFGPINTGLTYIVQSSHDLVNYSGLASSSAPRTNGNSQITITDFSPWPSNEFYRVQITLPSQ